MPEWSYQLFHSFFLKGINMGLQLTDRQARIVYSRLVERLSIMRMYNLQHPSKEGDEAEKELTIILDDIVDQVDVS